MIDLDTEELIEPGEAAKRLRVCYNTVRKYVTRGQGGILLDAIWVGDRYKTSNEAIQRFMEACALRKLGPKVATISRAKRLKATKAALKQLGI